MEQLDYNLLFRWFVGLEMDDRVWDPKAFTKNRERLLSGEIDGMFFERVLELARQKRLLRDVHFTVDGKLVEARAEQKNSRPRTGKHLPPPDDPRNATVDFRGQIRSNETHVSTTDPESRLYRKSWGTESKLCYAGHLLIENGHDRSGDKCTMKRMEHR